MYKVCRACGRTLPSTEDNFHRSKYSKDGFVTVCKDCKKSYDKVYYHKNKDRIDSQGKLWRANNRQYRRNKRLEEAYGCDQATYDMFFEKQNGVCAICGKKETRIAKGSLCNLAVDHDHETGQIRGLLCYHCNVGLGNFKDRTDLLQSAINYLYKKDI